MMGDFSIANVKDDKMKDISAGILIRNYDDIFSIFDPRPYNSRSLSDDFLDECKRVARDKKDSLEIKIFIPEHKRDIKSEIKIKKRLKEYFSKHSSEELDKIKSIKKVGKRWVTYGMIINLLTALGIVTIRNNFIRVIVELFAIPSWFLIWEGMSKIFIESNETKPEYIFYKKMSSSEIEFKSY